MGSGFPACLPSALGRAAASAGLAWAPTWPQAPALLWLLRSASTAICRATWPMRLGKGSRIEISLIRLVSSSLRGLSRNQRLAGGAAACDGDAADRTCVTGWWLPAAGPAWHQAGSWGLNAHGILGRALTTAPGISLLQQQELIILNKSWSLTP